MYIILKFMYKIHTLKNNIHVFYDEYIIYIYKQVRELRLGL